MSSGIQVRFEHAQTELVRQFGVTNCADTAGSLWNGLATLRKLLLKRLHSHVESELGLDSALPPVTAGEANREIQRAVEEIETYSLVLVIDEVARSGYVTGDVNRFRHWLLQLRFGDEIDPAMVQQIRSYVELSVGQRRRKFSSSLEQALPEARKTPLIIYRLFPRAVRIVTALAFGDALRARELRGEQTSFLPVIADCHQCHGLPLDNEDMCAQCGNPIWNIKWLNAID